MTRPTRLGAALGVAAVLLTGCGFKGAYSLPLPGGAATGKTYTLTAQFRDVQDLVPQNAVRVNDVAVGDVTGITYDPKRNVALVAMKVRAAVHLPANTEATLQQTTLLGEKYVALGPPTGSNGVPVPAVGSLRPGTVLPVDDTENLPDVETVFGLLSNVLNGGSLGSLETINVEITKALAGREGQVRDALKQLDTFVSGLDTQKAQIVRALDELDRFSGALARQNTTIGNALDNLPSGLKVLADEQTQFTHLLSDLSTFGKVATRVITSSRAQTVADFRDLKPVLGHLAAAGSNLPHALELLITFPFPKAFTYDSPGDYSGLDISLDADPILCSIIDMSGLPLVNKAGQPIVKCPSMTSNGGSKSSTSTAPKPTTTKQGSGSGTLPKLPKVPKLPKLPLGGLKSTLPNAPTKSSGGGGLGGVLGGVGGGG